jgi:outer membrane protein assembly factor BamB
VIVDDEGELHVLDALTGTVLQNLPLAQEGVTGSPVWDGTTLYLTTQDRRVFALRPDDLFSPSLGVLWEFDFGGVEATPFAAPLEVAGVLYGVTHDGSLWRVEADTGQGEPIAQFNDRVEVAPALDSNRLYIGTLSGNLIAFDLQQGVVLWQMALTGGVRFAPAVSEGRVYVHTRTETGGIVYALDAESGAMQWQIETQGFGNSSPVWASHILVVSGEDLLALDPETGEEIGRAGASFTSFGGTLVTEGTVYAVGAGIQNETVLALDAVTGNVHWRVNVPGVFIFSRPALDVASQTLVVGSTGGIVYGLDSKTGAIRWDFTVDGPIRSDIQIQNGITYLTSGNGTLYVLDAQTGVLLANARLGSVFTYGPPLVTPEWVYTLNGSFLYALELAP